MLSGAGEYAQMLFHNRESFLSISKKMYWHGTAPLQLCPLASQAEMESTEHRTWKHISEFLRVQTTFNFFQIAGCLNFLK